jgi:penicillin-binding protein 1C
MTNVSGVSGAGPLFHAILEASVQSRARRGEESSTRLPIDARSHEGLERVAVCPLSGEPAGPDCPQRVSEWRPRGTTDSETCSVHQRLRVDRRNGLRAGPGCADADVTERVFERFAPELAAWAEAAGRPRAPVAWSPFCPGQDDAAPRGEQLRIAYPLQDARYVVDPDRPRALQRVAVQILAPASAREATLRVDGREVAKVAAPFTASWAIEGGDHQLVATAGVMQSSPVTVHVRDLLPGDASVVPLP